MTLPAAHPILQAMHRAIVAEVGDRLTWNVKAYGKAWTGEDEDTEFVVGVAAQKALDALAEEAEVRQECTNCPSIFDTGLIPSEQCVYCGAGLLTVVVLPLPSEAT